MIDILSLIQQRANITLIGKSTRHFKNGQEHHSNCPWCGGKDRFALWPDVGRYYCRVCGKYGDMIQFLKDFENMSYKEACKELDVDPRYASEDLHPDLPLFMTRDEPPCKKWQESAELFLSRAERYLWTEGGKRGLDYLREKRGLNDVAIRTARLGFCPDWYSAPPTKLGTYTYTDATGRRN